MNKPMERSRPYDTSEPAGMDAMISELFSRRGYGRLQADRQLQETWNAIVTEVAGEHIASQTKVIALRNGLLNIAVSNGALIGELSSYHKMSILDQLRSDYQLKIRDLKFKLRGSME